MSFQGNLKADTEVKVVIGPAVSITDGFTPVTTLALSTADEAEILKHNATTVTDISGGTMAAITSADGYYNLTLTAANLDTEGMLTVLINDDSLSLPIRSSFMVMNANAYDAMYTSSGGIATEAKQDTIDTIVDAIKAKTDNLPADPASETNVDANETKIDTTDTVVDAIKSYLPGAQTG